MSERINVLTFEVPGTVRITGSKNYVIVPGIQMEIRCEEKDAPALAQQLRQWADLIEGAKR